MRLLHFEGHGHEETLEIQSAYRLRHVQTMAIAMLGGLPVILTPLLFQDRFTKGFLSTSGLKGQRELIGWLRATLADIPDGAVLTFGRLRCSRFLPDARSVRVREHVLAGHPGHLHCTLILLQIATVALHNSCGMELSQSIVPPSDPPSEAAVNELMDAWWLFTQAMKRHVAPMLEREHNLEFKDFIALNAIESGANYPGLICVQAAMTPSAVSRLIDELVRSELIVRRLDDHDSRRVHLSLTGKGKGVLHATRQTMHQLLRQGLSAMPETEIWLFAQTLQQLSASLSQPGPSGLSAAPTPQETDQP